MVSANHCAGATYGPCPSNLKIHDSTDGSVLWLDKEKEIFAALMIPRKYVLHHCSAKKTEETINGLLELQRTEKRCNRSGKKTGRSSSGAKYAILGNKVKQGGHGFSQDKLSQSRPRTFDALKKFAKRMEHITSSYVPSQWLRAITRASSADEWPTLGTCSFTAAVASCINYSAPAHVDDDFVFSIHQVNCDSPYAMEDKVCQHFCFPEFGVAIAQRPGDVLLFNPHVFHCLSERADEYVDVDVHVTSLYTKTAHVGKNNNSLPLTEDQTTYLQLKFS